jgi:hypothetical protein
VPALAPLAIDRDPLLVPLDGTRFAMRETAPLLDPDADPRPVTLAFHSLCFDPYWTCHWFQPGELAPQWQVCPRAPTACGGGGTRWDADRATLRLIVDRALDALALRHDARVARDGLVLVGYSDGAYAVARLLHAIAASKRAGDESDRALRFGLKGVVLFGAGGVHLDASDVRALDVRVGLTAGDLDGAAPSMRAEVDALRRAGVDARFVSLGRVGHFLPQSTSAPIAALIDWTRAREAR